MNAALSESANPIYELELLPPVHVAISLWGDLLRSAHTVFYLDNDAARAALCKGCGGTKLGRNFVQRIMENESTLRLKSWYARVPSHSNISDGPRRLDCTEVKQLGSIEVKAGLECYSWEPSLVCAFSIWGEHGHTDRFPNCSGKKVRHFSSECLTFSVLSFKLYNFDDDNFYERSCKELRFPKWISWDPPERRIQTLFKEKEIFLVWPKLAALCFAIGLADVCHAILGCVDFICFSRLRFWFVLTNMSQLLFQIVDDTFVSQQRNFILCSSEFLV